MTQSAKKLWVLALVVIPAMFITLLGGCSQVRSRSSEGHLCSISEDDDPYLECDPSIQDLVCIGTYQVQSTTAFVCRVACETQSDCRTGDDVCCPGPIFGEDFGRSKACVPRARCHTDPNAGQKPDGGMDAGAVEAGSDAPSGG